VRNGRDVPDCIHLKADGLKAANGRLAPGSRSLNEHIDLLNAMTLGLFSHLLSGQLSGIRRRLSSAFETDVAARRPRQDVSSFIGYSDSSVIERGVTVSHTITHILLFFSFPPALLFAFRQLGSTSCKFNSLTS